METQDQDIIDQEPTRRSRLAERRANRPPSIDPNQLYGVDEYAAARDMSRAGAYLEIKSRLVRVVKEGSRTKILGSEIIRRNREVAGDAA